MKRNFNFNLGSDPTSSFDNTIHFILTRPVSQTIHVGLNGRLVVEIGKDMEETGLV
jgi:hypothetical protein